MNHWPSIEDADLAAAVAVEVAGDGRGAFHAEIQDARVGVALRLERPLRFGHPGGILAEDVEAALAHGNELACTAAVAARTARIDHAQVPAHAAAAAGAAAKKVRVNRRGRRQRHSHGQDGLLQTTTEAAVFTGGGGGMRGSAAG